MSDERPSRLKFILLIGAGLIGLVVAVWKLDPNRERNVVKPSAQTVAHPLTSSDVAGPVKDLRVPADSISGNTSEPTHAADTSKLQVLDEILSSRNDNDQRLDTEFRDLTPAMKAELRKKYFALPDEDRNGRGTLVFLLGREIKTAEDVAFISEVLKEPPCQSLTDCAHKPSTNEVDEHAAMAGAVTLVYPQLVAIKSFERTLMEGMPAKNRTRAGIQDAILDALRAAENSGQSKVADAAHAALGKISN